MNSYYFYLITVHTKFGNGVLVEYLKWDHLPVEVFQKWKWYFIYRAALLQVKYPHYYVEQRWGAKEITNESPEDLQVYKTNKRKSFVKGIVKRFENAILKYECEQNQMLIPNFDNPKYLRTIEKIKDYKAELSQLCGLKK